MRFHARRVAVAVMLAWGLARGGPCVAQTFHSDQNGYGFDLPKSWTVIPQELVDKAAAMVTRPDAKKVKYEVGLQPGDLPWFAYPYIMVQVTPYSDFGLQRQMNNKEIAEMVRYLSGGNLAKTMDSSLSTEAKDKMRDVAAGQPEYDAARQRLQLPVRMAVNGTKLRGVTLGCFGREAMVQVNFYSTEADWDRYAPIYRSILGSFKFDAGKEFDPALADGSFHVDWSRVFEKAVRGGIIGVAIAAVLGIVAKRKRGKQPGAGGGTGA